MRLVIPAAVLLLSLLPLVSHAQAPLPTGKYVLVDVDHNEVVFMDGMDTLWAAPAGTGTGLRLEDERGSWSFETTSGSYEVKLKELNPVWIAPDWHFLEKGLPVPPYDHPSRRVPGGLGAAAIYIGEGLAIHGTNHPELLGQRVSHGCIRLANENAVRLFHNVQVGTPVVIRQRRDLPPVKEVPRPASTRNLPPRDPVGAGTTRELIRRMGEQILADRGMGWTESASRLVERASRGDVQAVHGLARWMGRSIDRRFEAEFATFFLDAFVRAPRTVVAALNDMNPEDRSYSAASLVHARMDLFHGSLERAAPWPTTQLHGIPTSPATVALQRAEERYREHNAIRREGNFIAGK